ncbi:ribonuclease T2-like [Oscarella lobularis]|uniref:ribonuclease T2-like n=1 Tax=Oscarella lobularis TaxID=121494 RepID=UPI0033131FAD
MKLAYFAVAIAFLSLGTWAAIPQWDYLFLVQQWCPAFCKVETQGKCVLPSDWAVNPRWTIHGLWPTLGVTEGPNDCSNGTFDPTSVQDLMPELLEFWPDCIDEPKYSFWEHEWLKHGTCAASDSLLQTEHAYFSAVLKLYKSLNLTSILEKHSIVPSRDKRYSLSDFINAFTQTSGFKPVVQCKEHSGSTYVQSILFCVDKTLSVMNCTEQVYQKETTCWSTDSITYFEVTE